jgi:hypothetical protein
MESVSFSTPISFGDCSQSLSQSLFEPDVSKELEKGLEISETTEKKLTALMPKILKLEDDPAINWIKKGTNLVFTLTSEANLIFKMPVPNSPSEWKGGQTISAEQLLDRRFSNVEKAKRACLFNNLHLLVIPPQKKVEIEAEGKKIHMIIEKRFRFNTGVGTQEHYYHTHPGLDETVDELYTLIKDTRFSDVTPRNIPLLDDQKNFSGPRQALLLDLELCGSAYTGLMGSPNNGSCGLIECLSTEQQIDKMLAKACKDKIITPEQAQEAKANRMKEIALDAQLQDFYARQGIKEARKPICIDDLQSLGLNLDEEQKNVRDIIYTEAGRAIVRRASITMRELITDLLNDINYQLQNAPEDQAVETTRYISLNVHYAAAEYYPQFGVSHYYPQYDAWVQRIIKALIEKGYVFQLVNKNQLGYVIQC